MQEMILALITAIIIGVLFGWLTYRVFRAGILYSAENEAEELVQEAKDKNELQLLEEKELSQEIETEIWTKEEPALLKSEERIEELETLADEKKQSADNQYSQLRQKFVEYENQIVKDETRILELDKKHQAIKGQVKSRNDEYILSLCSNLNLDKSAVQDEMIQSLQKEAEEFGKKRITQAEEITKEHSEDLGKQIIDSALARFARTYCGERGIAPVYFETPEQRNILCDPAGKNVAALTEITGCDIVIEPEMEMIGVAGFDPVRRELTRRLLERILKERRPVNVNFIKEKADHIKKELLATIKRDGDNLAKELGLQGLHQEIRQMMGSLRYRYSFTQNQYFHCAEVGWLCGLLAQELGSVHLKKARRAGMLHDLGKSMDHEMDGGHAVIGANFIEARKEAADIVHAVRSHHFDETPNSDLAFLVIAADAISGARPGARRSTMETYTQKVTELDTIARSFPGVTDCFVLNGGRELRVLVNGRKVDDQTAMKMGKDMATRIESECNYPGQIKVLVVRETLVIESTRAH